jgi:hypothetical protein
VDQDRDKWRTLVHAVVNSRVRYKVGSYLTSSRTALLHTVDFQDHSSFVEEDNVFCCVHHGLLTDLLDRPSDTVSQKDVSPVPTNANEILFHKQANPMTNSPRKSALVMHSPRLYAPESHKRIQNTLEVLSLLCQINPIHMVT